MATKGAKRGMGSIRKLSSSKHQLLYTGPNCFRRKGEITYGTKVLAEHALFEVRRTIEKGTYEAR